MVLEILKIVTRSLIFPQTCVLCQEPVFKSNASPLCSHCFHMLPILDQPICEQCGTALPGVVDPDYFHCCTDCLDHDTPFDRCRSWGTYENQLRRLVQAYKFLGEKNLAPDLTTLLKITFDSQFSTIPFDYIIPVPSHRNRLKKRGFDHIDLLCRLLSKEIDVESQQALVKTRDTLPQKGLPIDDRKRNLQGAFHVVNPERLTDKRVLIVDDVFTTGTTIYEAASTLRRESGVNYIGALTVGRVPRKWME